ncbi:amidohydrolase family protein [Novosphingobium terrae]|uniref:amidohydrolase family protein n=1 Tax=Novosphingobium terrae TaxID=2726189 RepID=UPI00197CD891|nr:amidohydrolase family protein [Novosphingobium terrae]
MPSRRDILKTGAVASAAGLMVGEAGLAQAQSLPVPAGVGHSLVETMQPKAWTRAQRPSPAISIDVHTHWAPLPYLKAKADLGQPDFLDPVNADLGRRIAWMDGHGMQTQLLTLGGFRPWVWVTPEQGALISRVSNDAAIEAHQAHPTRFIAGIELNASDPVGALAELNRVAGKPGLVCVHLPTALAGKDFLYDDAFQPVLARINDLGLPIILHPLDGEANWFLGKRLADAASGATASANPMANRFPGLTNSVGNSMEIAVCIAKLISSGTLDRYPNIMYIATCGGGAIPLIGGRMENRSGGNGKLTQPVYKYFRRFYFDSLVYWPENLRYLADVVGVDRIVLGTDNMYGPGERQMTDEPNSVIDQVNFSAGDRDLILRGNAKRLFKL